jgi:hypothetical protein
MQDEQAPQRNWRSAHGYFFIVGDDIVSWKSEKHLVVTSSAKVDYLVMAPLLNFHGPINWL